MKEGMSKADWIEQYKKNIRDYKQQIAEDKRLLKQTKNKKVQIRIRQDILWNESLIIDAEQLISNLKE